MVGAAETALKVTVIDPLPENTSVQGLVVPVHVEDDVLVTALQPPNVEPTFATAVRVMVAPLDEVEMFGEHVLVTVCEAAPGFCTHVELGVVRPLGLIRTCDS